MGVHLHVVKAFAPAQLFFQLQLQALLAHQVAHGQGAVCGHFLLVGLGYIAQHMGKEIFFRVAAFGPHHHFQAWPGVDFRFYARHQVEVDVRNKQERLKRLHLKAVLPILFPKLDKGNTGPLADLRQGGRDIRAVLPHQRKAVGRAVVGQHAALVVQNAATRGKDALDTQTVVLGLAGEFFAPVHLQIPKAHHQHKKHKPHHDLQQDGPGARRLVAFAFYLNAQPGADAAARRPRPGRGKMGVSFPLHAGFRV